MILVLLACANEKPVYEGASLGTCTYVSAFSAQEECREFFETDLASAQASCDEKGAELQVGETCTDEGALGTCYWEQDGIKMSAKVMDDDPDTCGSNKFGCETFAAGYWEPGPACLGEEEIMVLEDPWPLPERVCMDPVEGEAEGLSPGGEVCTWQIVSGSTEEGRKFSDYADCDVIIRQRGYSAVPPNELADEYDPRMEDAEYVEEVDWVRSQLDASSCECCHSAVSPNGGAVFDTSFEGNLANQFTDRGLAMGAGWIPTVGFGTYPPEENNGFSRNSMEEPELSIVPSTDQARMVAFFTAELQHRGRSKEEFANDTYGAGPLDAQLYYEPERCDEDEGVDEDGVIRWKPGRARYVYVVEVGSLSPTVPPNLDTPEGTLWRVDLPMDGDPVDSHTIVYGEVPSTMVQKFPESGAPIALEPGKDYTLYAFADVLYPISRCVFTAGEADPAACGCASTSPAVGLAALLAGLFARRRRA